MGRRAAGVDAVHVKRGDAEAERTCDRKALGHCSGQIHLFKALRSLDFPLAGKVSQTGLDIARGAVGIVLALGGQGDGFGGKVLGQGRDFACCQGIGAGHVLQNDLDRGVLVDGRGTVQRVERDGHRRRAGFVADGIGGAGCGDLGSLGDDVEGDVGGFAAGIARSPGVVDRYGEGVRQHNADGAIAVVGEADRLDLDGAGCRVAKRDVGDDQRIAVARGTVGSDLGAHPGDGVLPSLPDLFGGDISHNGRRTQ